jgi:hypothetical protein
MISANLGPLTISRPENWDVVAPQQQGQALTIAPRAGMVSNGFGYGVAINGVPSQGGSIDQTTSDIVRTLQGGGGDLQPTGKAQRITVAGVRGRSVMMQSTSPFPDSKGQSQKERDWLVTVPRNDGSVLFLVFVAPESEFQRFRPTFNRMLQSIR